MAPARAERSRVLLVEDDPAVRTALLGALEDAGFEAEGTGDAMEALAILAQRHVRVVVADYHLPGIAGLDLLAALRGTAPGTALILYSGGMTNELAAEARAFGVRVVLEKPVSAEQLVGAVRAALPAERYRPPHD
jgi:DNA-binding NtrC family response regulator